MDRTLTTSKSEENTMNQSSAEYVPHGTDPCDEQLIAAAAVLFSEPQAHQILVHYGHVRYGTRPEVNFILVTNERCGLKYVLTARQILQEAESTIAHSCARQEIVDYDHTPILEAAARQTFGAQFEELYQTARSILDPVTVNIFALPDNWKSRLTALGHKFVGLDRDCLERFALEAREIFPSK